MEVTEQIKTLERERRVIDTAFRFGVRAPGGWMLKQRSQTSWEYDPEIRDAIKGIQRQAQRDGKAQPLESTCLCLTQGHT
ncbi:MAG: hypothetical protein O2787_02980 [Cyanobacteria bacterium]|nr:hypothetical protein [Cyanobacteriota bacterium]